MDTTLDDTTLDLDLNWQSHDNNDVNGIDIADATIPMSGELLYCFGKCKIFQFKFEFEIELDLSLVAFGLQKFRIYLI